MRKKLRPKKILRKHLEEAGVPRDRHTLIKLRKLLPPYIDVKRKRYYLRFWKADSIVYYRYLYKNTERVYFDIGDSSDEVNTIAMIVIRLKRKGLIK